MLDPMTFRVADLQRSRAFRTAALAAGGRDNGPPGRMPHDHPHDCGASVIDTDGNNAEAGCQAPA